jgi:hypothetical protein
MDIVFDDEINFHARYSPATIMYMMTLLPRISPMDANGINRENITPVPRIIYCSIKLTLQIKMFTHSHGSKYFKASKTLVSVKVLHLRKISVKTNAATSELITSSVEPYNP